MRFHELSEAISLSKYSQTFRTSINSAIKKSFRRLYSQYISNEEQLLLKAKAAINRSLENNIVDNVNSTIYGITTQFSDITVWFSVKEYEDSGTEGTAHSGQVINIAQKVMDKLAERVMSNFESVVAYNGYSIDYSGDTLNPAILDSIIKDVIESTFVQQSVDRITNIIIHELVHINQQVRAKQTSGKTYAGKSVFIKHKPDEGYYNPNRTQRDIDIYYSNYMELPAYAHNLAMKIIHNAWDRPVSSIKDVGDAAFIVRHVIKQLTNLKQADPNNYMQRFNIPADKSYIAYKKFMKIVAQEVMQFVKEVEDRSNEIVDELYK